MDCEKAIEQLGFLLDGELPVDERQVIESHLGTCDSCRAEFESLSAAALQVAEVGEVPAPDALWPAIERGLAREPQSRPASVHSMWIRRRPLALAASIALAIGLSAIGLTWKGSSARAATVDFSILLDALPHDARAAFTKFLEHYDARESSLVEARRHAPKLNYDVPDVLPGGFVRKSLHTFRFGKVPGVAATYDRGGEFLAVVFHRPVSKEHYGPRREYPCMIGRHKGHKVGVGEWKLVHLTDPTTCHCLLSKLDEETELPAVMAAIAPEVSGMGPCDHDH